MGPEGKDQVRKPRKHFEISKVLEKLYTCKVMLLIIVFCEKHDIVKAGRKEGREERREGKKRRIESETERGRNRR